MLDSMQESSELEVLTAERQVVFQLFIA